MMSEGCYLVATDEVWEANRWYISTGWSTPVAMPRFADLQEKTEFKNFPSVSDPPEGWKWTSDWAVDKSQNFGPVDAEGWAYGTSFESLLTAIMSNSTSSESAGMKALVRRRRWVRSRGCYSKDIYDSVNATIELLNSTRSSIESSMRQQQKNLKRVKKFELARVKGYNQTFNDFIADMKLIGKTMRDYVEKLSKMKLFLRERSMVEKEYSQKLKLLSLKWINDGQSAAAPGSDASSVEQRPRSSITDRGSLSATDAVDVKNSTGGLIEANSDMNPLIAPEQSQVQANGFFYLVNSASMAMSDDLDSFSSLLSDNLCGDVEDMLVDVSCVASDCLAETPKLRTGLLNKEEMVVETIRCLHQDIDRFLVKASNNIMAIMNEIVNIKTTGLIKGPVSNSVQNQVTLDSSGYSDIFLCFQRYRKAVQAVNTHLSLIHKFYANMVSRARSTHIKVGVLLQSTVKIFASEHSRVWSSGNQLALHLKAIKDNTNTQKAHPSAGKPAEEIPQSVCSSNGDETPVETIGTEMDSCFEKDDEEATKDLIVPQPPECSGIVRQGMIRYCETPDILLQLARSKGVASIATKGCVFSDLYAVLFVDGMLHLYDNAPPFNNILVRRASHESIATGRTSLASESVNADSWTTWIGDSPVRSLCLAHSSGAMVSIQDPTRPSHDMVVQSSELSPTCEVNTILSSDAEQDVFKVVCLTTTRAASISSASASALSRSTAELNGTYSTTVSIFTSCAEAPEGDSRCWIQALIQPYTVNSSVISSKEIDDN